MNVTERPAFDLTASEDNGLAVLHLKGRLMDQPQADRLMSTLDEQLGKGHNRVVLELSGLQYMNSTGLNILINVLNRTRANGGDTVIAGASNSVRQLFLVTKLDTVFALTADVAEARGKFPG